MSAHAAFGKPPNPRDEYWQAEIDLPDALATWESETGRAATDSERELLLHVLATVAKTHMALLREWRDEFQRVVEAIPGPSELLAELEKHAGRSLDDADDREAVSQELWNMLPGTDFNFTMALGLYYGAH